LREDFMREDEALIAEAEASPEALADATAAQAGAGEE
jgi:hypothetical protein